MGGPAQKRPFPRTGVSSRRRVGSPPLLEQVRRACRARQFSEKTAEAYAGWVRRYVLFHGKRHPRDLDDRAIAEYLMYLANERNVSASTQRQASSALLFLYREVLEIPVEIPSGVVRPGRRRKLPTVLSREEVALVLAEMRGTAHLAAGLLYGSGLRLGEGLELRVKDLSFDRGEITVRGGKGGHDRTTMLPRALATDLRRQLERTRERHVADLKEGAGWVAMPHALARKMPRAAKESAWQFLFPATRRYTDPETGQRRRHHLHETAVQREVSRAGRKTALPATPSDTPSLPTCSRTGTTSEPSGSPRPPQCKDNHDLHPRAQPRRRRGDEPT